MDQNGPAAIQQLLKQMLEERGGETLSAERQGFYRRRARHEFMVLGCMNPFTVDPTDEVEAFKRLMAEVDTSGYW